MMNMPGVESELRKALEEAPNLGLGVHLNLTAGHPLSEAWEIPTLVDEAGRFFKRTIFLERMDVLNPEEVRKEWHAQVRRFKEVTGRKPTHIDSHHHVSYLTAPLFSTMLDLANEYDCAIRNVFPAPTMPNPGDFPIGEWEELTQWGTSELKKSGIRHPDSFVPLFFGKDATKSRLMTILKEIPEGVTELMCHPGWADDSLRGVTSYADEREKELRILTHPEVTRFEQNEAIELISFDEI
jgi:hypothetical protein